MSRINILDIETTNKIAAGEVVERPSSVVKELIENSIDAKSKNITIEIQNGGETLIKIIDDGIGIHPEDIKKAFNPHATSKIKSIEDVFSINTLGFRGEALPSIASVSKVILKSKYKDFDSGKEFSIVGGKEGELIETPISKGTQIEVRDIFFNVPARKKFLKSASREGSIINDLVSRIALANPDVGFQLYNNDKKIVNTYGNGKLIDTIRNIYGKNTTENLTYFEEHGDTLSVYGYIGNDKLARGSRNNQSVFVNKRYIKNKVIQVAVENAYKSFNTTGKFPFFILFIDIYPELIDVNIHPSKSEIKFKDERSLFKSIFSTVHKALREEVKDSFNIEDAVDETKKNIFQDYSNITQMDLSKEIHTLDELKSTYAEKKSIEHINAYSKGDNLEYKGEDTTSTIKEVGDITLPLDFNNKANSYTKEYKKEYNEEFSYPKYEKVENKEISYECVKQEAKFLPLRIIGQFNKTYILAEREEVLYLIDQHAAHEKILFEKYLTSIEKSEIEVQPLMLPILIELSLSDFGYYEENKDIFEKAGFLIDDFGSGSIRIKEVPYFLGKLDAKKLFLSILDNIKNLGTGKTTDVKYNKIASLSCKAAVKANDYLTLREMEELIEELRYIEDPFHCPHGRPTIIKFTSYELDKKFKRIL